MSDAAVDAAADGAAEAMETVATTTTTLATSALATISTYVSAHLTATMDEAARFCSDATGKGPRVPRTGNFIIRARRRDKP